METRLDEGVALLQNLSKEELIAIIVDDAKNWLAHDGLWFQAVENKFGIETAIEIDTAAWQRFTVVEAGRIMSRLGIEPGGGIPALVECLKHRLYARLNLQEAVEISDETLAERILRLDGQDGIIVARPSEPLIARSRVNEQGTS